MTRDRIHYHRMAGGYHFYDRGGWPVGSVFQERNGWMLHRAGAVYGPYRTLREAKADLLAVMQP